MTRRKNSSPLNKPKSKYQKRSQCRAMEEGDTEMDSDSSEELGDVSMEESQLTEEIEIVTEAYAEVKAEEDELIATEGLALYQRTLEQKQKKYRVKGKVVPMKLSEPKEELQHVTLRSVANAVVQKCPLHILEPVLPTPRMQYWTLTETNIMCTDEKSLSHMPYMEDTQADGSVFVEELQETFAEGIHGTKFGCGELLNDSMLYKMLKSIWAKHPDCDRRMIFRAVHNQFPNKASVRELPQLWEDLKRRFEPTDPAIEEKLMTGYRDGTALSSFYQLRCVRCNNYDCMLHGISSGEDRERKRQQPAASSSAAYHPCGPDCYMHVKEMPPRKSGSLLSANSKSASALLPVNAEADEWTVGQKSMFELLSMVHKKRFCHIAAELNVIEHEAPPKTCRQVYEYSQRMGPLSPRGEVSPNSPAKKNYVKDRHRSFRATKWASTDGKVTNQHNYEPCSHAGPCSEDVCDCVSMGDVCGKFCRCSDQCSYRFPGCRCSPGMCRTKQCQCFFANWECDPDVCKSCGCGDLEAPASAICKNIPMQRGFQKKLFIAPSQVAGWGCFTGEDIPKNDFISEYCGEVISHDESERRGKIYDKKKCSYLFGLNEEYLVDATRKGNVIRFANHSKEPNCKGRVFMVNGDHRIGIFARRHIAVGEELFFDYSYNSTQQIKFVSKERPRLH